jgi:S-methylmethionine-dependent homocysteine/selenocysteine methylase
VKGANGRNVASTWGVNGQPKSVSAAESQKQIARANARLIAAAPELLEACNAAMQCIGELPPTQARVEAAQMLSAAIAKATGAQS